MDKILQNVTWFKPVDDSDSIFPLVDFGVVYNICDNIFQMFVTIKS